MQEAVSTAKDALEPKSVNMKQHAGTGAFTQARIATDARTISVHYPSEVSLDVVLTAGTGVLTQAQITTDARKTSIHICLKVTLHVADIVVPNRCPCTFRLGVLLGWF